MCGSLPVLAAVTDWRWLRSASWGRLAATRATQPAAASKYEHSPVTATATFPRAELLNRKQYTPCALQLSGARRGCGGRRRLPRHAPGPRRRRCQRRRRPRPSQPGHCSGARGLGYALCFFGLPPLDWPKSTAAGSWLVMPNDSAVSIAAAHCILRKALGCPAVSRTCTLCHNFLNAMESLRGHGSVLSKQATPVHALCTHRQVEAASAALAAQQRAAAEAESRLQDRLAEAEAAAASAAAGQRAALARCSAAESAVGQVSRCGRCRVAPMLSEHRAAKSKHAACTSHAAHGRCSICFFMLPAAVSRSAWCCAGCLTTIQQR